MKIYSKKNVFDAGLDRIRMLFDEFEEVVVGYSGGKDSTVCLELSLIVAREKNRLPLKVMFLDQESEWKATIDLVEKVMAREEVEPMWFQMPLLMSNNASAYERFSKCWDEDHPEKWVHPKNPISIKENVYNCDRFHDMFGAVFRHHYKGKKACYIAGVRTEENPKRYVALTHSATYKWITWGKVLTKNEDHYTFYPIYDWGYTDIWKAIHENNWEYNTVYDELYRKGYTIPAMRVSNLHHETALQSLLKVQEIEPDTWLKIQAHVSGANTIKHLKFDAFSCPKELPYMFESWEEYCYHLIENIVQEDKYKDLMKKHIEADTKGYYGLQPIRDAFFQIMITTLMSSDWDMSKYANWKIRPDVYGYRCFMQGKRSKFMLRDTKFYSAEQLKELLTDLGIDLETYEISTQTVS
jgi:predicted phosphoadenosine phosphosulfate sulfurtransferase